MHPLVVAQGSMQCSGHRSWRSSHLGPSSPGRTGPTASAVRRSSRVFPCPRMWPQALQEERHSVNIGTCLDTLSWQSMCEHVVLELVKAPGCAAAGRGAAGAGALQRPQVLEQKPPCCIQSALHWPNCFCWSQEYQGVCLSSHAPAAAGGSISKGSFRAAASAGDQASGIFLVHRDQHLLATVCSDRMSLRRSCPASSSQRHTGPSPSAAGSCSLQADWHRCSLQRIACRLYKHVGHHCAVHKSSMSR